MYVETVLKAMIEAEKKFDNITCAYIVSVNRALPIEKARKTVDTMLALKQKWSHKDATLEQKAMLKKMVGIELGGDPMVGGFGNDL